VRLLQHHRELARLDRRDHAPGGVPADLGVVAEAGDDPAHLVGVLDQRLPALERHCLGELVGPRLDPVRDLVQELAPVHRGGAHPFLRGLARGGERRIELRVGRRADGRDRLLGERILDLELVAVAGHLLTVDQESSLEVHRSIVLVDGFAIRSARPPLRVRACGVPRRWRGNPARSSPVFG
jgi:hypothetical protein